MSNLTKTRKRGFITKGKAKGVIRELKKSIELYERDLDDETRRAVCTKLYWQGKADGARRAIHLIQVAIKGGK